MNDVITVVGNVASDPDPQTVGGSKTVTNFRLACTERRFDDEAKQWVDHNTNWYTVKAWEALGVHAASSLRKGERVIVTGRLRVRRWEKEDRSGTEVEISADALGHDLRWGTAEFTRTSRGGASGARAVDGDAPGADQSGASAQGDARLVPAGEDAWAAPGSDAEPTPF